MINEAVLQERYLRDATPRRLGNLASSVKRLGRFISMSEFDRTVHDLAQECRLFARWAAPEAQYETSLALQELQTDLEAWQEFYPQRKGDESWRTSINLACAQWSQRLLEFSGLLHQPTRP
jgi:hypothetical protein